MSKSQRTDSITLMIENQALRCKKKDLIDNSDYFKVMFEGNFAERNMKVITLQEISLQAMQLILRLLWEPQLSMSSNERLDVLQASSILQFSAIRSQMIYELTHRLNIQNCLKIWCVCEELEIRPLYLKAKYLSLLEFDQIKKNGSLFQLDFTQMMRYLTHTSLHCQNEFEVFNLAMQWYNEFKESDTINARERILKLMHCFDFQHTSVDDLEKMSKISDIQSDKFLKNIFSNLYQQKLYPVIGHNNCDAEIKDHIVKYTETNELRRKIIGIPFLFVRYFQSKTDNKAEDRTKVQIHHDVYKRKTKYVRLDNEPTWRPSSALVILENADKVSDTVDLTYSTYMNIPPDRFDDFDGLQIASTKEFIFFVGGEASIGSGAWNLNLWVYDIVRDTWQRKTRLPTGRRHFSHCICGPYLYIIGGAGTFRVIQENMYWYNYEENIWSTQLKLPCTARQTKCCNHNGKLLLLNMNLKCGYLYNHELDKFTPLPIRGNLTGKYDKFSLFSYGNYIYVKSTSLLELAIHEDCLMIQKYGELRHERKPTNFDIVETVACKGSIITMYKCTQTEDVCIEVVNYTGTHITNGYVKLLDLPSKYNFDMSTRLFTMFHFHGVAKDSLIYDVNKV